MNCRCGRPAHPLYNGRCEDCWVGGQRAVDPEKKYENILGPHLKPTGSSLIQHVQEFGDRSDRMWHRHAPKSES